MQEDSDMKVDIENYRGIEFIRISSLPEDQKKGIWNSFNTRKIIKILRDNELLNDCVRYDDYRDWYQHRYLIENPSVPAKEISTHLKFALK